MDQFQDGVWNDYSQPGGDQGRFTLSKSHGSLLLSFLTVLVTVAGASVWTIVSLIVHSWIVRSRNDSDVFDIQQQITLRNAKSPLGTIIDIIKLSHVWSKKKAPGVAARTITVLIPTLVVFAGTIVASIFASRVAIDKNGGGLALARNRGCGITVTNKLFDDIDIDSIRRNKIVNDTVDGRSYALNFYQNDMISKNSRSSFVVDSLPFETDFNAPCPVANASRCSVPSISFESHMLDSHSMFGINARKKDRIATRAKTTCTIINIDDRLTWDNQSTTYWLGRSASYNYTFNYPRVLETFRLGYQFFTFSSDLFFNSSTYFKPIDQLQNPNGDVALILLLQLATRYSTQVNDPLFEATFIDKRDPPWIYQPNWLVRPLLCVDQYMVCNPTNDKCSPYGTYQQFFDATANSTSDELGFNDAQSATAARMGFHMQQTNFNTIVASLGANALFARDHLIDTYHSTGLKDNQWHLETTAWFQTKLAKFQASVAEYVSKPDDTSGLPILEPDDPSLKTDFGIPDGVIDSLKSQCNSQLVIGPASIESFSLAGTLVIAIVTTILFTISIWIKEIMNYFGRFVAGSKGAVAREADEKLHILRHALSVQHGPQNWDISYNIPVTEENQHVQWPKTAEYQALGTEMKEDVSTDSIRVNTEPRSRMAA